LSYKPNTPVTQDSHSIIISSKLQQKGFNIIAYDKLVQKNITFDKSKVVTLQTLEEIQDEQLPF
jgi:UDP-glucose 6-dehydrogenase